MENLDRHERLHIKKKGKFDFQYVSENVRLSSSLTDIQKPMLIRKP